MGERLGGLQRGAEVAVVGDHDGNRNDAEQVAAEQHLADRHVPLPEDFDERQHRGEEHRGDDLVRDADNGIVFSGERQKGHMLNIDAGCCPDKPVLRDFTHALLHISHSLTAVLKIRERLSDVGVDVERE